MLDSQGTDSIVGIPCSSGMRFKSGRCISDKMVPEVKALQRFRELQGIYSKANRERAIA